MLKFAEFLHALRMEMEETDAVHKYNPFLPHVLVILWIKIVVSGGGGIQS